MPHTPCRQRGCPNIVKRKDKGYCDEHADQRSNWTKRQRRFGNSGQRGYGHEWRKLRKTVLERDDYLCVICRDTGVLIPATDVDHIVPKAQGGTDDSNNLQSLCKSCHRRKTANE
ncbi:HNH endonuclease [Psychrobacter pygoscelis]|uniref:HNH endonuclease n=1 Tax=Psychrobacter pygoscelis TaxID=2488563 RepID=UPI0010389C50|nr:HNH endonuclease [Psychrobacter pygoscelis]